MAKYIEFDFSDTECYHIPIIVRIDKDIEFSIFKEIDESAQKKMDEYIENGEYWDTDEILVTEVMDEFSKKYDFNYEIVTMDYTVDCN